MESVGEKPWEATFRPAWKDRTMRVLVGCDLGQQVDPSALVVAHAVARATGEMEVVKRFEDGSVRQRPVTETVYAVRHVERLPLKTAYRKVGWRVAEIVEGLERLAGDQEQRLQVWVLADATGLGRPAIEAMRETLGTRIPVSMVTITSGEGIKGGLGSREVRVSKAHLVSRLQSLLENTLIELPETEEARMLAEELQAFRMRASSRGIKAEAEAGHHDDLAIALMLGVLFDPELQWAKATGVRFW